MSIGNSGRIVIEVDPGVKRHLYTALARDGMSLKEWFLKSAQAYLSSADQMTLERSQLTSHPRSNRVVAICGWTSPEKSKYEFVRHTRRILGQVTSV